MFLADSSGYWHARREIHLFLITLLPSSHASHTFTYLIYSGGSNIYQIFASVFSHFKHFTNLIYSGGSIIYGIYFKDFGRLVKTKIVIEKIIYNILLTLSQTYIVFQHCSDYVKLLLLFFKGVLITSARFIKKIKITSFKKNFYHDFQNYICTCWVKC